VAIGSKTKLPAATQKLVSPLFDEKMLAQSLEEMEIDLSLLPVGRISHDGMREAFEILNQLQTVLKDVAMDPEARAKHVFQHTNKFYN
jgi:hypothetical protein